MKRILVLLVTIGLVLAACGPTAKTTRVSADTQIDLTDRWNDTDLQITAEQIVKQVMGGNWLLEYVEKNQKKPVVIVGTVANKSSEHIETSMLVRKIQSELINSGKVRFVADAQERLEVRQERMDQQKHASEETAKNLGEETGADFMLKGEISSISQSRDGETVKYFQVNITLINLENNLTVWMGDVPIKKFTSRDEVKW